MHGIYCVTNHNISDIVRKVDSGANIDTVKNTFYPKIIGPSTDVVWPS